jgi:Der1-like family
MSDLAWFWSAPPVTRTLVAATVAESILCHGGLLSFNYVIFYKPYLFKLLPDVWRLFTPFLLTGGGLGFIFDLYFCVLSLLLIVDFAERYRIRADNFPCAFV